MKKSPLQITTLSVSALTLFDKNTKKLRFLESIFILDLDKVIDTNTGDNGVGEVTSYMKLQLQTVSSADGEYWNNTGKI